MPDLNYCQCGCGDLAPVAKLTRRGYIKGERMRFIHGHHMRTSEYKALVFTPERNAKISAAHADGRIVPALPRFGSEHAGWRGNNISYTRAHARLVNARGEPGLHACVKCGKPAQEWAFKYDYDGDVKTEFHGGLVKAFSADAEAYDPLCRSCHRSADRRGGYRA